MAHRKEHTSSDSGPLVSATPTPEEPLPLNGPIVYISHAKGDAPEWNVLGFATELRRLGVRAQIDELGFVDDTLDQSPRRFRQAVERSDWFVLMATKLYLSRTRLRKSTGIRTDLQNIGDCVLREPFRRERVLTVLEHSDVPDAELPQLTLGLGRLVAGARLDPKQAAGLIQAAIRNPTQTREVPIGALTVWRTELVGSILDAAGRLALQNAPRWGIISVGALLAGMLAVGSKPSKMANSARWLWDRLSEVDEPGLDRFLAERFPNISDPNTTSTQRKQPPAAGSVRLGYDASSVLAWASLFAEKGTSKPGLWGVHVLASLFHRGAPWTEKVDEVLTHLGIAPERIRNHLAADLPTWQIPGTPDLLMQWNAGAKPPISTPASPGPRRSPRWNAVDGVAGVSADDAAAGEDHLDIKPDVQAFAKVLASWELEPPLAIGLFGDWGSGKTFFMKSLKREIERLSEQARSFSDTLQKDVPYCKYVVQVEFNAWHYSEGDLWACLVDHIFTNLRLSDGESESEVARRRKMMLVQMQTLQKTSAEADVRKVATEKAIEEAEKEVDAATQRLTTAQSKFTALSVRDIWNTIVEHEDLRKEVQSLLTTLGINTKPGDTASALREAIDDAKSLGGRTKQLVCFLWSQRANPWAYAAFAVAFGMPALLMWLSTTLKEGSAAQAGAVVTGVLGTVGGFVPIYRTLSTRMSEVVEQLDKPRRMAEEARRFELQGLEKQIEHLTLQRHEAEQHKKEVEDQQKDLQTRLDGLNADRMLADFLQDRAASDDYRKRLGTLALIRRDFERLADLMKTQRQDANAGKEGTDGVPPHLRVNRIVLYIDDLDRCAPKQVVEVLQAIHLLLAFPLFVVVVGVDARWVQRSIKHRYRELLRDDYRHRESSASSIDTEGVATPRDYLEKIFQVPFWLQPLGITTCRDLMDGLLGSRSKSNAGPVVGKDGVVPTIDNGRAPSAPDGAAPSGADVSAVPPFGRDMDVPTNTVAIPPTPQLPADAANPASPTVPAPSNRPVQHGSPVSSPKNMAPSANTDSLPKPPMLGVTPEELDLMKQFAPIVGRSPRAVKRFINCYRLFKAVVPDQGLKEFVSAGKTESPLSSAEMSLFFLATIVGAPGVSAAMNAAMNAASGTSTLDSLHTELSRRMSGETVATKHEWQRITPVFEEIAARAGKAPIEQFKWIIDRAWRFSFHSGAQQVESLATTSRERTPPP